MLVLSRPGSVPAVARDVGGLAVLPLVVAPRPGVGAIAYNMHQHTTPTNERECHGTGYDFGDVGGTPSAHAEIDETRTYRWRRGWTSR